MLSRSSRRTLAGAGLLLCATVLIASLKAMAPPYAPRAPEARTRGPAGARVTLAEFTDFQCPGCRQAVRDVKDVEAMFPEMIRVVYKYRPLKSHLWAKDAAAAAECAGRSGKFWPMHDLLFERQEAWAKLREAEPVRKTFLGYWEELGLDAPALKACLADPAVLAAVEADAAEAEARRINATPTFFINGKRFVGSAQLLTHGLNRIENILKTKALRKGGAL